MAASVWLAAWGEHHPQIGRIGKDNLSLALTQVPKNAVSFSPARTTKRFPPQCASVGHSPLREASDKRLSGRRSNQ